MKYLTEKDFSQRQVKILQSIEPGNAVRDIRVLRKLSKLGVVVLHEHTGCMVRHVWGMLVRAFYISSAETFEIVGVGVFAEKLVWGCFSPYLIKTE